MNKENWFEKHLNVSWGIALALSILILTVTVVKYNNSVGLIIFLIALLAGGVWVIWQKGRSYAWLLLILLSPLIYAIVILCLQNKRWQIKPSDNDIDNQTKPKQDV